VIGPYRIYEWREMPATEDSFAIYGQRNSDAIVAKSQSADLLTEFRVIYGAHEPDSRWSYGVPIGVIKVDGEAVQS
jgi:hypothetical protein